MLDILKNIFKKSYKDFPQDSSWMIDKDGNVLWKNIERCKEFADLKTTPHSKRYHQEGSPLKHTKLVVKEMQKIIKSNCSSMTDEEKRVLVLAALCHDLGKATTTYYNEKEQDYCCKSHGAAGEKITRKLLYNEPIYLRDEVCWLVRWHMEFHHILNKKSSEVIESIKRLSKGFSTIEKLAYLNLADSLGSKSKIKDNDAIKKFNAVTSVAMVQDCFNKPYSESGLIKDNFTVYVMIGLPGSGKDTYISKFLKDKPVICRDDIREEVKDGQIIGRKLYLSPGEEKSVTNIVNERIKNCCTRHISFVINQTSLKKKYRQEFNQLIYKYATPRIVYIYIEAPSIEECIRRRGEEKWTEIINRMNDSFEFPEKTECDELLLIKSYN